MQSSNNELPVEQWNQRGEQLLTVGRYEEAIEYFDKAIEIYNNSRAKEEEFSLDKECKLFKSWHLQGICFYELKRYREATKCFHNIIEIYQNIERFIKNANHTDSHFIKPWYIADVWYENGLCFSNLEDYEEANRCFDKAIEEDSNFGDAWHNKGIALLKGTRKLMNSEELVDITAFPQYQELLTQSNELKEALEKATQLVQANKLHDNSTVDFEFSLSYEDVKVMSVQSSK